MMEGQIEEFEFFQRQDDELSATNVIQENLIDFIASQLSSAQFLVRVSGRSIDKKMIAYLAEQLDKPVECQRITVDGREGVRDVPELLRRADTSHRRSFDIHVRLRLPSMVIARDNV
jgi:hypothetical protein